MGVSWKPVMVTDMAGAVVTLLLALCCAGIAWTWRREKRGDAFRHYMFLLTLALALFAVSRSVGHIVKQALVMNGLGHIWQALLPFSGALNSVTFVVIFAFSIYFQSIKKMHSELEGHRNRLEEMVARRTGELERANAALTAEVRERERAETRLKESQDRLEAKLRELDAQRQELKIFQAAIEQSIDGIAMADMDGYLLFVNHAWARMHGYEPQDLVGRNLNVFHTKEQLAREVEPLNEQARRVGFNSGEVGHVTRNGRQFPTFMSVSLVRSKEGKPVALLAVARDITEQKKIEALRRKKEAAELANRAKSEFLANMSHEIRTPLNGVIGNLSLLAGTGLGETQREYVSNASTSAEILLALLNDILDFSKIEAGKLELEETDFDIKVVIEAVVASMKIVAAQKGVEFRVGLDDRLPECLRGDDTRLRQVLMNLMSNAVKFTRHGWIEFIVRVMEDDGEQVKLFMSVEDTGIGISSEKIDGLFQQFTQADGSITRKFGGTGLGLAISKKLVEMMNGEIGVESEPGKGSKFWFTVRLVHGDKESDGCQGKIDASFEGQYLKERINTGCEAKRILVVDDNLVNQQVILAMLGKLGLRAEAVSNGEAAVEALSAAPYDLVFMDVQMPVMDGMEATKRIRTKGSPVINPNVPVIALTAHAFKKEIKAFLEAGMNDHLAKPILPDKLVACLVKWLKCETSPAEEIGRSTTAIHGRGKEEDLEDSRGAGGYSWDGVQRFDIESLDARTMDDPEVKHMVIKMFCDTMPAEIHALANAIESRDLSEIRERAHAIKGASANIAGMRLSAIAAEMEQLAANAEDGSGVFETLSKRLTCLEKEYGGLEWELRRVMEK